MRKHARSFFAVIMAVTLAFSVCMLSCTAEKTQSPAKYKNVILFIGDGMGINSIRSAKRVLKIENQTLNMETMPVKAWSKTRSLTSCVTDSAAGGTALACGIRTYNGGIGNYLFEPFAAFMCPINLTDVAIQEGKSTGVVTTDTTDGATPSSFSAHAAYRKMSNDISGDQLRSDIDLIWGGASDAVTKEKCEDNGFEYVSTQTQMDALKAGTQSFGQFSFDDFSALTDNNDTPTIEEMTTKAIGLLNADRDGFFLMVEGAHIDKKSHDNLMEEMSAQLYEFDKAIGAALDFASKDGETLIVVTADHETGGITLDENTGDYYYTKDDHTGVNVPLFVSADDAGFNDGEAIKNKQVSRNISAVLDTDGEMALPESFAPFWRFFSVSIDNCGC